MTSASDTRPSRLGRVLGSLWSKLIAPLIVLVAAFYGCSMERNYPQATIRPSMESRQGSEHRL